MPFTADGRWVPKLSNEEKKNKKTKYAPYRSYDDDKENRPSYEPDQSERRTRIDYGTAPRYDGDMAYQRGKSLKDVMGITRNFQEREPLKATKSIPRTTEGPSEQPQRLIPRGYGPEERPQDLLYRPYQGPSEQPQELLRRNFPSPTGNSILDNFKPFGPSEEPQELISRRTQAAQPEPERKGFSLKEFLLPNPDDKYKPGNTSLSEILDRPLDKISSNLTFGITDKFGPQYSKPDNFAEQVADKVGTGLSYLLGGGVVKQAGGKAVTTAGRTIAERFGRANPLPTPNPTAGRTLSQELAGWGAGVAGFAGAQEFAEGFQDPDIEDRNAMQQVAGNMRAGFYTMVDDVGDAFNWRGYNEQGAKIKKFAEEQSKGFKTDYSKEFTWKSFLDPEYYKTTVAQTLPSTIAMLPFSVIGYGAGAVAAGRLGLGAFGRTVAGAIGGTALSAPMESAMIAGSTFDEAVRRGNDEGTAEKMGNEAFWKALAVTAVTQAPEIATMFAPVKRFIPQVQNQMADIAIRVGAAGTLEGTQEALQDWAQKTALGDEWKPSESGESFGLGFLLGGSVTGASAILGRNRPEPGEVDDYYNELGDTRERIDITNWQDNINPGESEETGFDPRPANAPNPIPGERSVLPADSPVRDIQKRAKDLMSDQMRTDFDEEVESFRTQGMPQDVAELHVWESVALTDEGKDLINRATRQVVDEKARAAMNGQQTEQAEQFEETVDRSQTDSNEGPMLDENGEQDLSIFDVLLGGTQTPGAQPTQPTEPAMQPTVIEDTTEEGIDEPEFEPTDEIQEPVEGAPEDVTLPDDAPIQMGSRVQILENGETFTGSITDVDEMNGVPMGEVTFDDGDVQLYPLDQIIPEEQTATAPTEPIPTDVIPPAPIPGGMSPATDPTVDNPIPTATADTATTEEVPEVQDEPAPVEDTTPEEEATPDSSETTPTEGFEIDESELSDFRRKFRESAKKRGELFLVGDKVTVREPSENLRQGTVVGYAGFTNEHSSTFLSVEYDDTGETKSGIPVKWIVDHNGVAVTDPVRNYEEEGFTPVNEDEDTDEDEDMDEDEEGINEAQFDYEVKEMKNGSQKITVKLPDSKRKAEFLFHGKGPDKGNISSITIKEGNSIISESANIVLDTLGLPHDLVLKLDNVVAALEGRDFKTSSSEQTDIIFLDHKRQKPFAVYKDIKEAWDDDMPFIPDFKRRGVPVQTYFFEAEDNKRYVVFREEGKSPGQPQPADVFLKSAEAIDYTDLDSNEFYDFTPPTYETTLDDLEVGDYVEFTDSLEGVNKGFVAEINREDGLVILENKEGKRPWLPLEVNRLNKLPQEDAPDKVTQEKFVTVDENPLILSSPIELTYTRNPSKRNRLEITFNKEIPSQVKAILQDLKIRWIKTQQVYAGTYSDEKMEKVANLKLFLARPLSNRQVEALKKMKSDYDDTANSPDMDPKYRAPMGLYFHKDTLYLEENAVEEMKFYFSVFGETGTLRKSPLMKKLKDLPDSRLFLGDVRQIGEYQEAAAEPEAEETVVEPETEVTAQEEETVQPATEETQETDSQMERPSFVQRQIDDMASGEYNTFNDFLDDIPPVQMDRLENEYGIGRKELEDLWNEHGVERKNRRKTDNELKQDKLQAGFSGDQDLIDQANAAWNQRQRENEAAENIPFLGDTITVLTPRRTRIEVQYALVDVNSLITSNDDNGSINPDFPKELQPRDRTRSELQEQITTLARTLEPELLGANPLATDGAPIVGPDLVVESGNGRTMALRKVFNQNAYRDQFMKYQFWLDDNAETFGFNGEDTEENDNLILVRIRRSDINREQFADEANDSTVSSMSASEAAANDSQKISGTLMNIFAPNDDGEINTAPNRTFIARFLEEVVAPAERNRLKAANGMLSQDGLNRVRNAIFYRAYGDPTAIATMAESTDNNVRNIINSMIIAAPRVAFTNEQIAEGSLYDIGISEDIVSAMNVMNDLRENNTKIEEYLQQLSLLEDELTPVGKELLRLFDTQKRSVKKLSGILLEYHRGLAELGDPRQESLFEGATPTREQLLDISIRRVLGDDDLQASLFETEQEQNLFEDGPIDNSNEQTSETGSETAPVEETTKGVNSSSGSRGGSRSSGPRTGGRSDTTGTEETQQTNEDTTKPMRERKDAIKRQAEKARERLKKRHGGNFTAHSGLPMDDILDYAIIGMDIMVDKTLDFAEFTEVFVREFGENVRGFMGAIYGQTIQMMEMTEDEIENLVSLASNDGEETQDGTESAGDNSEGTLEETPSEDVPGNATDGDTQPGTRTGSRTNNGSNISDTNGPGTEVSPDTGDERGAEGSTSEQPTKPSVGNGEGNVDTASGRKRPAGDKRSNASVQRVDFQITDELDNLGGAKTRFKNNVEALRTLVNIEREGRLATPEEQSILARYIGWGGISQAFDDRNKQWTKEYAQLKSLVDDSIISQEDYERARASTTTAFYTSKEVINGVYTALQRFGYESGGRILEPSVGTGNFFGFMPATMLNGTTRNGVELDNLTARIAKQLYQRANIRNMGFQEFKIADGHFDIAIGNVPFGDTKIVDANYKGKVAFVKNQIHNYFFIKSLDKVREGGIVAFVTSSGTMNSKTGFKVRQLIGEKADFLGAIRLPGNAFKENANTEVTTDIIFLQKRPEGQRENHVSNFFGTMAVSVKDRDGNTVTVQNNEYFINHPEMELGERTVDKLTGKRLGLMADDRNFNQSFNEAINRLPENIYTSRQTEIEPEGIVDEVYYDMNELTEGGIGLQEGKLVQKVNGEVIKYKAKDVKTEARIRGMLPIREAARNVLQLQKTGVDDTQLKAAQDQLNNHYETFVKKFGYLNDQANRRAMIDDPVGASLLASLEKVKETGEGKKKVTTITKEAVFTERTINAVTPITSVDTSEEALVVALFENGSVDLDKMTALTNKTQDQIIEELQGRIYQDPFNLEWQTADEYLSGNVRVKLRQAEYAASQDPVFQQNVEALREVVPEDLTPNQITVRLGAPWVPASDMQDFINELLEVQDKVSVRYLPQTAQWFIEEKDKWKRPLYTNARNTSEFGIRNPRGNDTYAVKLIEDSLNLKLTTITYKDPIDDKTIVDVELTNEARQKQKQIQSIFQDWLWEDGSRQERLLLEYNERFNSVRLREYDGSIVYGGQEETNQPMPGMSEKYTLRPHQKDAVWRTTQGGNTLLAHVVGAGKTLEMIAAGMEMKRLGFISKPAYVVPNHLLDQWEKEFREAYPGANILKIGNDDIPSVSVQRSEISEEVTNKSVIKEGMKVKIEGDSKKYLLYYVNGKDIILKHEKTGKTINSTRDKLKYTFRQMSEEEYQDRRKERQAERGAALNKIAVGNYDAILITHQTFQKLPMSPETVQAHIREQILELDAALRALAADGENNSSRSVKALENAKTNLEAQIRENLAEDSKDIAISFEELGIDQIFVDESHMFKNLKFHTKMNNVAGLPQTNSQRAQDMYLKTQWLSDTRDGKGVVFASGTPISNTMAEMFNLQRYLQMRDLRANGIGHFDAWAALFGESVTGIEMDTTGKFRQKTRFARFHNVAELMTMFKSFADVKTADMLDLPTPDNVNHETIIAPMSDYQEEYLRELQARAEAIKNGNVDPTEDNYLKLTGDGRKMALDVRMVNPDATDFEESKLNKAVDNIARIYKDETLANDKDGNKVENHTQVVFLDMGTPRKKKETDDNIEESDQEDNVSVYEDIRNKLIRQGIPKDQVAFIHDANTDKKKQALFNNMNEGKVRILLGSTEKMGAGMNVQKRLVALHHLDAPWRPSDVEQREGRIVRQGNMNNSVNIYAYTTEGSFDAIMWDTIRRKATFIQQVMNGTADVRSIEDVEAMVMGYTEIVAVTSGNPLIQESAELQKEMLELQAAKTGFERSVREARKAIREIPSEINTLESHAAAYRRDAATKQDTSGPKFTLVVNGQTYLERAEAGEALIAYIENASLTEDLAMGESKQIGTYAGFPLYYAKGKKEPFEIRGSTTYRFMVNSESKLGTIQRLDRAIANLEEKAERFDEEVKQLNKNIKTYQKTVEKKFDKQDQLNEVSKRYSEVQQQIIDMNADDQAVSGETEENQGGTSGYSGTSGIDTFVPPITGNVDTTGEENRRWRGRLFEEEQEEERSVNRTDILGFISQAFKVPIGTGKYKGRAQGIYKRKVNIIRTKQFADFVAIAHELGHRLDDQFNFSLKLNNLTENEDEEVLLDELYRLASENLDPTIINETVPLAIIRREGFAEFVRLYFDNPRQLHDDTPRFYEYFSRTMSEAPFDKNSVAPKFKNLDGFDNATSLLDALDISADMMDIWRDQRPEDRIDGVIDTRENRGLSLANLSRYVRDKFTTGPQEFYDSIYEELAPIDRAVKELTGQRLNKRTLPGSKDPFVLAWNTRGVSGKIRTFIDFGVVNEAGEKVGPSLREILESVTDLKEFKRYLIARHAKDLIANHGKVNTPIETRDADKIIRDTDEEYKEAADRLYEYQESVTNELVKAGLLDTKQVDDWKLSYPYYVPFYRVMEDEGTREDGSSSSSPGRRFGNQRNPVKRMKEKGSARNIIDPLESVIKNTYMYLQIAERNQVGRALADLVDGTEDKDTAWLMEKIDTPMMAQKFNIGEIQSQLEAANIDLEYADMDQMAAVFRPMFQPSVTAQELTVYRNGKPVFYKVKDKALFKGLLALERESMNWIMKLINAPNQLLRQTITATPDFVARQFARTWGTTFMQTQSYKRWGGLEAIKLPFDALRNLGDLIFSKKQSARYFEWLSGGGAASTLQELDRDYLSDSRNSLLVQQRGLTLSRLMSGFNPMNWLRTINAAGQTVDEAFRMAEYFKALEVTGDRDTAVQRSRDVDYDPARFGNKTRNLNRILLFFNPAIQGMEKTIRTFKDQPGTTLLRGAIFLTAPTLALLAINWDDEEYWELPSWRRDMFWNIPMPGGGFLSIPIPFEWGILFKTLPERTITKYMDMNKDNPEVTKPFNEFVTNVRKSITPEIFPTIIAPIIEWKTNADLSFGTPIVPMGKKDLEPGQQYDSNTSELAKLIGSKIPLSPMQLDNLYEGYTGTAGQFLRGAADKTLLGLGWSNRQGEVPENQRNIFERVFKGFAPEQNKGSSSINMFYDKFNKMEAENKKENRPGYVKPELKQYRSAATDLADMRAMKNYLILENDTLTAEEKAQWVKDIDSTMVDYARVMLGKPLRDQATDEKVFAAMEWFSKEKKRIQSENKKQANRDFGY